ncbi:hypothetical protein [Massilia timonae]|uniref:hypothetical protein n=1 Tax=Massilia timonae TaxID=47229 RepID=UPI0028A9B97B|nr:hypothetical protein [Massilia timonae]
MKKGVSLILVATLVSGCASSAHDRRMADADGESNTGKYVAAGLGLLAIGALAYAAGQNTGSGYAPATPADYDWAWDLQRGGYNNLVWVCRGRQTGQYADQSRCAYKYQADNTWPGY